MKGYGIRDKKYSCFDRWDCWTICSWSEGEIDAIHKRKALRMSFADVENIGSFNR